MPASASQSASYSALLCASCLFKPSRLICFFDFLTLLPLSALSFSHHQTFKAFLLFPIWSSPTFRFCRDNVLPSRRLLCELSSQIKAATPPGRLSPGSWTQFLIFSHLATYLSFINPSFCLFINPSVNQSIPPSLPLSALPSVYKGYWSPSFPLPFLPLWTLSQLLLWFVRQTAC